MYLIEARLHGRATHWPVGLGEFVVGRADECDVILQDASISRRHVAVRVSADGIEVRDLGSTNGLIVDGEKQECATIGLDSWFAAGAALLAVRRGVFFNSRSSLPHAKGRGGSDGTSGDRRSTIGYAEGGPPSDPNGESPNAALSALLARIDDASGPEQSLHGLLEHVACLVEARGIALLGKSEQSAWVTRALQGELPPSHDLPAPEGGEAELENEGGEVTWYGPVRGANGVEGALLIHPAPRGDALLWPRVAARLAGAWLEHVPASEDAPTSALPVKDDTRPCFIAVSGRCRRMLEEADRLAASELAVLLRGETGTGKDLLARRVHTLSARSEGPFVALNCASLPSELLESELFGIERGVATGVSARPGRFALASGGTLFLDEIADMPLVLQAKVLRAVDSGEILPLGARQPVQVDVRLVSATHQDLAEMVREGRFRRDLYHRLAAAEVELPPLRERPEDILPIARNLAERLAAARATPPIGLDLEAARTLVGYSWPGNVRELRHVIERAMALADGCVIHAGVLPPALAGESDHHLADAYLALREEYRVARRAFEALYFKRLLGSCDGNLSRAARAAGLARGHFYRKLDELGLR